MCSVRAVSSQLPSCVKSFVLPIAYQFHVESQPDRLFSIFPNPSDLILQWIVNTPKFSDDASKLSYLGLIGVLKATVLDLKIAGLRVRRGGEFGSKDETILLQTKIVHCFSEYLEYTVQDKVLASP